MPQMSGQQFAAFLREEVAAQNKGLGKLSYEELGRSCGITGRHLRRLASGKDANPSVLIIRLVLHTLGYRVDAPEHDILPHLKSNGGYVEELLTGWTSNCLAQVQQRQQCAVWGGVKLWKMRT